MEDTVFEKIYKVVRKIPRGKVATYGQIAALAGNPRWARHVNPDPSEIPCYRVVNRLCVPVNRTQQVFTAHLIFIPCLPSA